MSLPKAQYAPSLQSMEGWAEQNIEPLLMPGSSAWQPTDILPDSASPDFLDSVRALQRDCRSLPLEYWVVMIGNMVTEEALPSYLSMLNRMDGIRDESGRNFTPATAFTVVHQQ
jgi:acyl-[acyl-carrier-protein] desaturase